MFQVSCPECSASCEYNVDDYIHLCPYCSTGFVLDLEEGAKDIIGDHFIVPNRVDREQVEGIFSEWISKRYHRPEKIKDEFRVLGSYGISLPYWVISVEAHTFWSGHSQKAQHYEGQGREYGAMFLKEENRFSRRYRWAILARKSPKEHWGLERIHHPKENVLVDWDGFPIDETLGIVKDGNIATIYDARQPFKFDHANGITISGVQVKESSAIARARDQIQEYHRRVAKTKVGTLYEHRTELEIVGIHLVHLPFWNVRYSFAPKSLYRILSPVRERRILIQGHTSAVLDAELPLTQNDKVTTNLLLCGVFAVVSLGIALFHHPAFFLLTVIFSFICILSAWKTFTKDRGDSELNRGVDLKEPAF